MSSSDEAMNLDSRLIRVSVQFGFATARVGFEQEGPAVSLEEATVTVRTTFHQQERVRCKTL